MQAWPKGKQFSCCSCVCPFVIITVSFLLTRFQYIRNNLFLRLPSTRLDTLVLWVCLVCFHFWLACASLHNRLSHHCAHAASLFGSVLKRAEVMCLILIFSQLSAASESSSFQPSVSLSVIHHHHAADTNEPQGCRQDLTGTLFPSHACAVVNIKFWTHLKWAHCNLLGDNKRHHHN